MSNKCCGKQIDSILRVNSPLNSLKVEISFMKHINGSTALSTLFSLTEWAIRESTLIVPDLKTICSLWNNNDVHLWWYLCVFWVRMDFSAFLDVICNDVFWYPEHNRIVCSPQNQGAVIVLSKYQYKILLSVHQEGARHFSCLISFSYATGVTLTLPTKVSQCASGIFYIESQIFLIPIPFCS